MLPRPLFEQLAANLTGQGFKILLDLALSSPAPLRVIEIPCVFHERVAGESKLDALVLAQFAGLLLDKVFGGLLPLRFISFALVGALGVLVHLAVLTAALKLAGLRFEAAQAIATVVAMVFNFQLNNEITYRDQRLRGPRLWRGLLLFMVVCGVGAVANIGIAKALYETHTNWTHRRRDRCGDRRGVELRGLGDAGLARAVTVRQAVVATRAAEFSSRVLSACCGTGRARRADAAASRRRRIGPAGAGRGLLLGVVARAGARLSGPSADGGAVDPPRHHGRRRRRARRPAARPAVGGGRLAAAGGCRGPPAARASTPACGRGAAECDAAVRRRRRADDARRAAARRSGSPACGRWRGCCSSGNPRWWLAVGLFAGLAMASKYTAALLWFGIALWLLVTPSACGLAAARRALARRSCSAVAVFLPVVAVERRPWLGRASPGRAGASASGIRPMRCRFLGELLRRPDRPGHAADLRLLRRRRSSMAARQCLAHPRSGVDPAGRADAARGGAVHGTCAGRPGAGQLAGHHLSGRRHRRRRTAAPIWRRLMPAAVALGLAHHAAGLSAGRRAAAAAAGHLDPIALQLAGWDALAAQVERGTAARPAPASSRRTSTAWPRNLRARCRPGSPVIGVGRRWAQTGLPRAERRGQAGHPGQQRAHHRRGPTAAPWSSLAEIGEATRRRDSETIEVYWLYRVAGAENAIAAVVLPRP